MSAGVSTSTPSVLVFNDTDDFTSDALNSAFSSLDLRTRALEALSISWQDAVNTLNQYGLQRLNDALQPVYTALIGISQIGQIFTTTSASAVTLGSGTKSFVIAAADQTQFAAAGYITAVNTFDLSQSISGRTQSYDRKTGTLSILADTFEGTAGTTVSSWTITAAVDFNQLRSFIDQAIAKVVGSADTSGDTLGELEMALQTAQLTINNLNTALAQATAQASSQASSAQSSAITTASANALALAIALG